MSRFLEADLNREVPVGLSQSPALSLSVSAILHGVLLVMWCWQPGAVFVKPRLLAKGYGGTATPASMPLYIRQDPAAAALHEPALGSLSVPAHQAGNAKANLHRRSNILERDQPADDREAGSRLGASLDGPAEGDEIKQGFAIVFVPPHVSRWELPRDVEGDVIVELTIDAQGNVVEEKLLQGLGDGVDDKVLAAVRDWRFRPATRNGVAVPFKYDARFHFPS
jgi:TonB family protein